MPTTSKPLILHVDPKTKRYSWPWKSLGLGDIVHVYAPPRVHSKVYAAGAYRFLRNPNLRIITKKHTDAAGEEYIRCEVVDKLVHYAKLEKEAARLAALTEIENARAAEALREINENP